MNFFSIFVVRAGVDPVGYLGSFSSLMPSDSYDESHDEDVLFEKRGTKAGVGVRTNSRPRSSSTPGPWRPALHTSLSAPPLRVASAPSRLNTLGLDAAEGPDTGGAPTSDPTAAGVVPGAIGP